MDNIKLRYERKGKCNRCGWCCLTEDCEHFKDNLCGIFGSSERPAKCINFPQAPPILNEKCGFYFLDTWENNKIVKFGRDL